MRLAATVLTAAILAALAVSVAGAVKDETILISAPATLPKDSGVSSQPAISADGRYVVFASEAATLHPDDTDAIRDVFRRDLDTNEVTLVSRADDEAKLMASSSAPAISGDGRYVAFETTANLEGDAETHADVYVRDVVAGTTALVSRVNSTGTKGNNDSTAPAISADGRYVAFVSEAKLNGADADIANPDVYRFDRAAPSPTVELASRAGGVSGVDANNFSSRPSISADGARIAFDSTANNLDSDSDTMRDVFVRDFASASTTLVSASNGTKGNEDSIRAAISGDGRFVAFDSEANNLDAVNDGGAFDLDVYVRDLQGAESQLVSRGGANDAAGNNASKDPSISADGRYVAFDSLATNFGVAGAVRRTYVRDRQQTQTALVSRADGEMGEAANADSAAPAISGSGRFVAFDSIATNLEAGADGDSVRDVFVRDVLGPPDTTAPIVDVPAGVTAEATGPQGAAVGFAANATDNVAIQSFACTPAAGSTFAIGATTVTCTATDTSANVATASFTVTVVDTTAPTVMIPAGISTAATDASGAGVTFDAAATDLVGVATFQCTPASGTTFAVGDTTVTCTAADVAGNKAERQFTVTVTAPPGAAQQSTSKSTAKLSLKRATIDRRKRVLDVLAPISARASGAVDVTLRSAGRTVRFKAAVAKAQIRFRKKLPGALATKGTGILEIAYPGDDDTRPQSVRLRAASRPAKLVLKRPALADGRLLASGTVARSARGVVRVQLEYEHGGATKTVSFSAPIERGRWALAAALPAGVRAEIDARTGTVHSYTLFTGYEPAAIRGEMSAAQVLGAR